MKLTLKIFIIGYLLLAICYWLSVPQKTHAQLQSLGLATYLSIQNSKVENGDIIANSPKGFVLSNTPYDQGFEGVVNKEPAMSIRSDDQKNGYPVVSTGTVPTKVNDKNGEIKKGDYITTSDIPGVGVKAIDSGYVIGQAQSSLSSNKKGEVKLVPVALNPHLMTVKTKSNNAFVNIFSASSIAAYEKPSRTLQYALAALITLISFGAGFVIFAKAINTGLEALGRNPLAGRMIQVSLIFNLLMIVVIVVVGTGLAYLVLRL